MQEEITFLAFSFNDDDEEQMRLSLFIRSLQEQTHKHWNLIFWDASKIEKRFIVPEDSRIKVIRKEITDNEWNPAYIRNLLALQVQTTFLCHTNSDVYFAPNFVSVLMSEANSKNLVMCRRKGIGGKSWEKMKQENLTPYDFVIDKSLGPLSGLRGEGACGECQCMSKNTFLIVGGYYGLISKGEAIKGDWSTTACMEDCDLVKRCQNAKSKINIKWIHSRTHLIHMNHPSRQNKQKWNDNKNKKQTPK